MLALLIGALGIASILGRIDWVFTVGGITAFAAWELTKWRLRRNARNFVQASR
jgi:hypothetical protein